MALGGKVLLVGAGSIGRYHLKYLSVIFKEIYILDTNLEIIEKINSDLKIRIVKIFHSFSEIDDFEIFELAVISNLGPDHYVTFINLVEKGVKNFFLEKPLADSLLEIDLIRKAKEKYDLRIETHFQWSESFLFEQISNCQNTHNLGPVDYINVTGGAKCIATNGIHYLAMANILFGENPLSTFAVLNSEPINPRRQDLKFLGGISTWLYKKNKLLTILFSNTNRNSPRVEVFFLNGRAEIVGDNLKIWKITEDNLQKFNSITRTFYADQLIFSGEAYNFQDGTNGTNKIYGRIIKNEGHDNFEHGAQASEQLIKSLISNETGLRTIINNKVEEKYLNTKWSIS